MRDARVSLITLGVADLSRSSRFYEALGWTRTDAGNDKVVFLQGEGVVLSLFGLNDLAEDAGLNAGPLPRFRGMTLAINLTSEAETDRLFAAAIAAGGDAVKRPETVFWGGYSGYVADPDGHLWELAHNPFFPLDAQGRIDLTPPSEEPA
ncbi:VOC family protein [Aureimonas phyllosphaerae]|uniref:VOC domain-containing protein n=1 Tax=Aureimonas phyllosphaerae TaxID=1166078 RepID=A0A7W6C003_9HYPH|nr:VOC family protein [Aureimonas phyllosphaerae]MBB3935892.1 hypothetical protein [Aureimonas phyllosphaerae]MBB3959900.1 hypothetical protein [Aureimonas phyllosphaerae]SFF56952.1 hypothetical protein SAMN05216566_13120 [Aureimonas phyllosphaerae]